MIDKLKALAKKHGITSAIAEAAPASEEEVAPTPETPAEEEADDAKETE